jgi:hypothetical protein
MCVRRFMKSDPYVGSDMERSALYSRLEYSFNNFWKRPLKSKRSVLEIINALRNDT